MPETGAETVKAESGSHSGVTSGPKLPAAVERSL